VNGTAAQFARDVATHELAVLRDAGVYRHLRFQRVTEGTDGTRSRSSLYWFDIVTWPGCLVINGDMDSYLFGASETDMLTLFRGRQPDPSYWTQKIRAGKETKRYSEDLLRQAVAEYAEEQCDGLPGLPEAIDEEILNRDEIGCEDGARRLLTEFEFGTTYTAKCSCGTVLEGIRRDDRDRWETGHCAMAPIGSGTHKVTFQRAAGFRFSDSWEWDLCDWTHQYLWCCHAIPWAIQQYDEHRAAAAAATGREP
jgi:hypothetical protein